MGPRGKIAAAGVTLVAAVTGAVLLWPTGKSTPTSDEIKASAQARLDASLLAGRKEQLAILAAGQTPDDALCQKLWDRKTKPEQQELRYAMWMTGCVDTPQ